MVVAPEPALELQRVTIHGHERAFVKTGEGPALLLLHGLGCDHTTWAPVVRDLATALHGDRPRPAGPRGEREAARRLLRRRLRQRDARPAHRPRDRQGHRGRAQLRRRRGDAVRLPVPRAHRADDPGRAGRPGPRGQPRHPGDHAARVPHRDGDRDPSRHPARRGGRAARAVALEAAGSARPRPRSRTSTTPSATRGPVPRSATWSARSSTCAARSSRWSTAPT